MTEATNATKTTRTIRMRSGATNPITTGCNSLNLQLKRSRRSRGFSGSDCDVDYGAQQVVKCASLLATFQLMHLFLLLLLLLFLFVTLLLPPPSSSSSFWCFSFRFFRRRTFTRPGRIWNGTQITQDIYYFLFSSFCITHIGNIFFSLITWQSNTKQQKKQWRCVK